MTKRLQGLARVAGQACLVGIAILALAGVCLSQAPSDWPQFHNANMQRSNPNETVLSVDNAGDLRKKWSYAIGRTDGSPIVANGVVYIGADNGVWYAVNASNGALLWSYQTASGTCCTAPTAAIANGVVYFGSLNGVVYALNASTGAKLWSYQTAAGADIESAPTVVNGVVYVGSNDGNLYAFDASTGALLWSYNTGNDGWCSPAVANGVVYVGSSNGNVYALNGSSGALLWSYAGNVGWSSPAVADGVVYVVSGDNGAYYTPGNVYALNASTGAVLWSQSIGAGNPQSSSPAVANGMVYIGSGDGNVYALNASTGAELWSYTTDSSNNVGGSPAVANGVVYIGNYSGVMYALNASTGAGLWDYQPHGTYAISSSPAVANGLVYVASTNGYLYAFGLPGPELSLRAVAYPTPTVPGGLLTYALKVWNKSSEKAVHEVLTTSVPAGTTFSSIELSGTVGLGSCTTPAVGASGSVVCKENSVMKPGSTWTVRLTVEVMATAGTVLSETATASSDNLASSSVTVQNTIH
jgi:outer membrane protein assembly factor BamB